MEKLTIQHLKGYLGTGLKVRTKVIGRLSSFRENELDGQMLDSLEAGIYRIFKPYLLPLSYLTKEITHNGETFVPYDLFIETFGSNDDTLFENMNDENDELHWSVCKDLPYYVIEWLLSLHFDVHGLIEKNLAIDASTLTNNPYTK